MIQLDSITDSMDRNSSKLQEMVKDRGVECCSPCGHTVRYGLATEQQELCMCLYVSLSVCMCICDRAGDDRDSKAEKGKPKDRSECLNIKTRLDYDGFLITMSKDVIRVYKSIKQ